MQGKCGENEGEMKGHKGDMNDRETTGDWQWKGHTWKMKRRYRENEKGHERGIENKRRGHDEEILENDGT